MVQEAIKKYGAPVYVRHEIVHNKYVVDNLKSEGAIFVEELSEIDQIDRPVIFSAHGVPKSVPIEAEKLKNFEGLNNSILNINYNTFTGWEKMQKSGLFGPKYIIFLFKNNFFFK